MSEETQDIKIAALMSVPMCGWNPHWGCVSESFRPFQIPIRLGYGAFWHQTMSNLLQDCIDDGLDWVMTLDYDSMFTAEHVDRLIGQFGQRSDIDALAALQCKRGTEETPLMSAAGQTHLEINGNPVRADTAHFGLTLFRLDALRKMPMPWFSSVPDQEGSYRTRQRTDADIDFWHKWKKAGNTLYVDPMCAIGHLQPMVATYDERFNVRHLHVNDWRAANRRRA